MKIYTKSGDKGTTSLIGGNRIEKDSIRVEAYGTIDELNSYIGLCYHYLKNEDRDALRKIQTKLFDVGAELSSLNYKRLKTILTSEDVEELEKLVDYYTSKVEKINEFIDDNFAEDDNIHISEDEIVISRTFSDEGDNK